MDVGGSENNAAASDHQIRLDAEVGDFGVALGEEEVQVVDLFSDRFGMNVVLENDVKAFTLGECLFGQVRSCSNLVNLWIGAGHGSRN